MKKAAIFAVFVIAACLLATQAFAGDGNGNSSAFQPNTLVVSRSVYAGDSSTVTPGQTLPPGCVVGTITFPDLSGGTSTAKVKCGVAIADGTYPTVFNNDTVDGSFGITSPIFLDNIKTDGTFLSTLAVPTDRIVTSFSSKSELALNLAADGNSITFAAYHGGPGFVTGPNQLDVSNSNTPGVVDPSNPVVSQYFRAVAEVDGSGNITVTDGNAYSGNNGRGAIKGANGLYYMSGNNNNGGLSANQIKGAPVGDNQFNDTQVGIDLVSSTGVELVVPLQAPAPLPPTINKIGEFSITQAGYANPDKPGKDNNFRGLTIFNNTLYVSKGSGGNGINTVYQVGESGTLPTGTTAQLRAEPITILPGFSTVLAAGVDQNGNPGPVAFPFGLWFADANTLYVCDEGDGVLEPAVNGNVASPSAQATAGVQKWISDGTTWHLAYILQNGLNIGIPYSVPNLPSQFNPATDGCRNITGRVNGDGTTEIFAVTSTVSGSGDQGADPNKLISVRDELKATTPPNGVAFGQFVTIRAAGAGEVLRGVTFAPRGGNK